MEDDDASSSPSSLSYHPLDADEDNAALQFSDRMFQLQQHVINAPAAVTPCQSFDMCLDLRCGRCYDAYLGAHTTCGAMTYYDCAVNLPKECRPMKCTDTDLEEVRTFLDLVAGLTYIGSFSALPHPSREQDEE